MRLNDDKCTYPLFRFTHLVDVGSSIYQRQSAPMVPTPLSYLGVKTEGPAVNENTIGLFFH
jgi:hypothetical protein